MLCTTTDTLLLPILSLVSACSTRSPGCKGCIPASSVSPTSIGAHHHKRGLPEQELHLAFENLGLEWSQLHMFLHQDGFIYTFVSGLCGQGLGLFCSSNCPLTKGGAVPCLLSKRDIWVMAHGTDNLSISLSLITLIILQSIQVPNNRGTCLKNSDLSGTMRKTMSSSYPVTSAM